MKVIVNNIEEEYPEGFSLQDIVSGHKNYNKGLCLVFLNDELVFRKDYEKIKVKENDKIRVVKAVSGG